MPGQKAKAAAPTAPPLHNSSRAKPRLRGFGFLGLLLRGRAGIRALGGGIAVHELDDRHRGGIAVAEAGLQHAGVAARTTLVAVGQNGQQLGPPALRPGGRDELAAGMEAAALAESDQLLDDRTQVLRLRQSGLDLLMLDQRLSQILANNALRWPLVRLSLRARTSSP